MKMVIRPNYINKKLFLIIPLVGIIIMCIFLISYGIKNPGESVKLLVHGILMTTGIWLGCMAIVMYLWEKFPWEQAPVRHLVIEIVFILAYTVSFSFLLYFIERKVWDMPGIENAGFDIFITLLITFLITSIHESIFFYRQWKFNFSRSVRLEKDNIEARYEALKAQINPHFLFNSLNSLATMVEDNKPVVDYVQNLSELLRYMLKSGEKELVLLRDEITILNYYIRLQQARFPGTLGITIDIPESFYHFAVPPLVLQMLVENCLKHNIISKEKPLKVEIRAENGHITVSNNLQRKKETNSTRQGLKNITGRYRFFTSKKVEITETPEKFNVSVPLLQVEL